MSKETTGRNDQLREGDENLGLDWHSLGSAVFELDAAGERLRDAVLAQTSRVVRRRGRVRRLGFALAILLVFSCGFITGSASGNDPSHEVEDPDPGIPWATARDPEAHELQAEIASSSRQAALYREAGNLYAESGVDGFERAILCFGQSLVPPSTGARIESRPDDHWLMLALARAREMEGDL